MTRRRTLQIFLVASLALSASAVDALAAPVEFLTVSADDDNVTTVNVVTGAVVGSVPITLAGEAVDKGFGLARHPITGDVYALIAANTGGGGGGEGGGGGGGQPPPPGATAFTGRVLVTVNTTTGVATLVGDTGDSFAGIAFLPDGTLLGVTGDGAATSESLFSLSTVDGTPTLIRALGFGDDGETIAVDPGGGPNGLVYHASGLGDLNDTDGTYLETLDPLAAFAGTQVVYDSSGIDEALGAYFDTERGLLIVTDLDGDVFTVSPTGTVAALGGTGFGRIRGLLPAPVPEPASYALFGLGLVGLAARRRRRRAAAATK